MEPYERTCCGKVHQTPFCPTCECDLRHPLMDLLYHAKCRAEFYSRLLDLSDEQDGSGRSARALARREGLALDWERWYFELRRLMGFDPEDTKEGGE